MEPPRDASHPFRVALLISLMNPKAILFFGVLLHPVHVAGLRPSEYSVPHPGVIVQFFSALPVGADLWRHQLAEVFRRRRRLSAGATGGVGGLFIGFGLRLAGRGMG